MITLSDNGIQYYSVAETARRLGKTSAYLYKLINQGKLRPYKDIGDRKVLRWDEVLKALEPQPIEPDEGKSDD